MSDRDIEQIVKEETSNLVNEIFREEKERGQALSEPTNQLSGRMAAMEERIRTAFRLAIYRALCSYGNQMFQQTIEQLNQERN